MRRDSQAKTRVEDRLQLVHAAAGVAGPLGLLAEHLDRNQATKAELRRSHRRHAAKACVRDRRDSGPKALGRSQTCDREELVRSDTRLALDVGPEPGSERLPVPEAGVDRVLEVRVGVDEPRDDDAVRKALPLAELGGGADGDDAPAFEGDGTPLDRGACDR